MEEFEYEVFYYSNLYDYCINVNYLDNTICVYDNHEIISFIKTQSGSIDWLIDRMQKDVEMLIGG